MPFAELHTRWPGDRSDPVDPALLQFLVSGGPLAADAVDRQSIERDRLVELSDHIDLAEHGVRGNSHGSMFERHNADVLRVITEWMTAQIGPAV